MLPRKAFVSLTWLTFLLGIAEIQAYWLAPGSRTPIPGLPSRNGVTNPCPGPNDWYQTATRQCFNYVGICNPSRGLKWMRCSHYSSRCMETWKVKPCQSQPYRRQVNGGIDQVSCYFRDFQECWNVMTPQQCYALSVCFSVGYGERSNYNTRVGSLGRRLLTLDPDFDAPFNLTAARMQWNASVPALQVVEEPFKHVRLPMGMASIS